MASDPSNGNRPSVATLSGTVTTFSSQIVVAVLSLVHIVIVARSLGAVGRGEVVFLTTLAGLTGFVSTLSAQEGMANQAGTRQTAPSVLATNAVGLAVTLGGLGAIALVVVIENASSFLSIEVDTATLIIAALAAPGFALMTYLSYLARANYAFALANFSVISVAVWIFVADALLAVSGNLSVRWAVTVWVSGQYVGSVVFVRRIRRTCGFGRPDVRSARDAVSFGARAHGAGLLNTGTYRMDQWLLGALAGAGPLGVYSVAVAWFEGLFLLPTAFSVVARPSIVEATSDQAGGRAEQALRLCLVGITVAGIAMFLAAPILVVSVFGDQFSGAALQLRILVPGAVGIAVVKILGNALTARGRPGLETAAVAIGFVAGAALYLVLVPPFGGNGAAIASTVAYLLAGAATIVIFVRTLGTSLRALIPGRRDIAGAKELLLQGRQTDPSV